MSRRALSAFCFFFAVASPLFAATFNVTNLNDSGSGSLRAAIVSANASAGPDTVTFQNGLTGTITLTSTLEVTDSIAITGPGSGSITISGNHQVRAFLFNEFGSSHTHTVSGLTITDAYPVTEGGAGIFSQDDDLTLNDIVITNCIGGGAGGGLYFANGALSVSNSTFSGNWAENAGSCFELGDVGGGQGGGIMAYNVTSATFDHVTITGNKARADGGGLGVLARADAAVPITINACVITGNTTNVLGCDPKSGGGVYVGGMGNDDTLTIADSTISNNVANGNAGGLLLGDLDTITIRRSTISGNQATSGYGGGIVMEANENTLLENVTVSGNTASTKSGGIHVKATGFTTNINSSTITGNGASVSAGLRAENGTAVNLRNSIVANSVITPANTVADDLSTDGTSSFVIAYTNVETPGAATVTNNGGNVLNQDPVLGALQNNGGTTLTHLPGSGSPVFNAGDPAFTAPPSTDQRGFTRVLGAAIDMGSVESDPPANAGTIALSSATYSIAENGTSLTVTVTRTGGSTGAVSVNYATSDGSAKTPSDYGAASGTLNWAAGDAASKTFNIPIVNDTTYEGNETLNVTLSNVTGGANLGTSAAVVTITEDESYPVLTINSVSKAEGNSGTTNYQFTVTLSPQSAQVVTVNFATVNVTAGGSDYTANTGTLTFAVGVTSQNVNISVLGDTITENDETFNVVLSSPTNANLGAPSTGVGTLQNDDPPTTPTNFSATGTASTTVTVSWTPSIGAATYTVERQLSSVGSFTPIATISGTTYFDNGRTPATSYRYRVIASNAFGGQSSYTTPDIATTVVFTDPSLVGVAVKPVHFTELRTAINAVRAFAGLGAASYSETPATGMFIKAIHVTEMRTALDAAASGAGIPSGGYTDSPLAGVPIKAVHLQELRDRVK